VKLWICMMQVAGCQGRKNARSARSRPPSSIHTQAQATPHLSASQATDRRPPTADRYIPQRNAHSSHSYAVSFGRSRADASTLAGRLTSHETRLSVPFHDKASRLLHTSFLFDLLFDPEYGGNMLLSNQRYNGPIRRYISRDRILPTKKFAITYKQNHCR
jgi:hypothetical protein